MNRILINSLPKSGTHLLAKAIEILGYQEHFSQGDERPENLKKVTPIFFNYREVKKALESEISQQSEEDTQHKISVGALTPLYVDQATFYKWLDVIAPQNYILGHIPWTPLLSSILKGLNYYHLFIIRDPRAVVVSSIPFVLDTGKMPAKHFLEDDFKEMLPGERLNFILEGGYAAKAGVYIKNFAEVYRSMLAWRNDSNCLFLRFEDLVGEQGGGSSHKQMDIMKKIVSYLGIPFTEEISGQLKQIYNPDSRTFRMGKIDGWKNSIEVESLERLIEYCKPLCQEAGYEL